MSLMCILVSALIIVFLVMAPSIINANANKKNRQEP